MKKRAVSGIAVILISQLFCQPASYANNQSADPRTPMPFSGLGIQTLGGDGNKLAVIPTHRDSGASSGPAGSLKNIQDAASAPKTTYVMDITDPKNKELVVKLLKETGNTEALNGVTGSFKGGIVSLNQQDAQDLRDNVERTMLQNASNSGQDNSKGTAGSSETTAGVSKSAQRSASGFATAYQTDNTTVTSTSAHTGPPRSASGAGSVTSNFASPGGNKDKTEAALGVLGTNGPVAVMGATGLVKPGNNQPNVVPANFGNNGPAQDLVIPNILPNPAVIQQYQDLLDKALKELEKKLWEIYVLIGWGPETIVPSVPGAKPPVKPTEESPGQPKVVGGNLADNAPAGPGPGLIA